MNRLQRYANAIAAGVASVFPIFLVIYSVLSVCAEVALAVMQLAVQASFSQQTFNDIAIALAAISLLISVIACIYLMQFLLEYLKYHTYDELTENSMLE